MVKGSAGRGSGEDEPVGEFRVEEGKVIEEQIFVIVDEGHLHIRCRRSS
jgi:hypothetical protein